MAMKNKRHISLYGAHDNSIRTGREREILKNIRITDYNINDESCPDSPEVFSAYNVFQYKSNERPMFDRNNLFNNGIGEYYPTWNASTAYNAGDDVNYRGTLYAILGNTNAGESPETHPDKFGKLTNYSGNLGLITDKNIRRGYRLGYNSDPSVGLFPFADQTEEPHKYNFMVLNNQGETENVGEQTVGDNNIIQEDVQNLNQENIFRPTEEERAEVKLYDGTQDVKLMEYVILHFKKDICQEGWLYLEIDEPEVTGEGADHMVHVMVYSGNPNVDDMGDPVAVDIKNQYKQNTATNKAFDGQFPELDTILSETEDGDNIMKWKAAFLLSQVQGSHENLKLVLGLNTPFIEGQEKYYTVIIGLRPSDLKAAAKIEKAKDPADVPGPSPVGFEYEDYLNPEVGDTTLSFSGIRVVLDKDTNNRWDDEPIPSFMPGSMDFAGKGTNQKRQYLWPTYSLFPLDINNDVKTSGTPDKYGIPNEIDAGSLFFDSIEYFGQPMTFLTPGSNEAVINATSNGQANQNVLFVNGSKGQSWATGNIIQIGNFNKVWFGNYQFWKMRLPRMIGAFGYTGIYGDDGLGGEKLSLLISLEIKVGLYRHDKFQGLPIKVDLPPAARPSAYEAQNGLVMMRDFKENATLITEWDFTDFYSDVKDPINNPPYFNPFDAKFDPCNKADMYKDLDILTFQGDDPGENFAKYFLVFGSPSDNSGLFMEDQDDFPDTSRINFPTYGARLFIDTVTKFSSLELTEVDNGGYIFQGGRYFFLNETPTPTDYEYDTDPNVSPF